MLKPDYIFEVSWEICNKVGGINTVIYTKAHQLSRVFQDNLILVGPDVWRETIQNPSFEEDDNLFRAWKAATNEEGLRIRIGRWKTQGRPIVILVDFSTFIPMKNDIFKKMWELYKLDSISGQHDYVEASMFGYAAAKTIESFWNFYLSVNDNVIAQFHEWMSGMGVLYLKEKTPQIATVFTSHATVTGRSIAGNDQPLYDKLPEYNGDVKAKELSVTSKHSLEKLTAHNADCFTTVSDITANECKQLLGKEIDIVTPNGFDDSFIPPEENYEHFRSRARAKLLEVAGSLLNHTVPEDSVIVANSGRYEFKNKGIDIFIRAMGELNKQQDLEKTVIAYILVPANNYGPRRDLKEKLESQDSTKIIEKEYLTHGLHDKEFDPILNALKESGINNKPEDKVKIIFVPSYLNGNDGIFNLSYYNLLIGIDLTIFPSYYEPWGYTPLESLAFHVPTVTTDLAGIGMWVNKEFAEKTPGIDIVERSHGNGELLVKTIIKRVIDFSSFDETRINEIREGAYKISRIALWKNLISHYFEAYHLALTKVKGREELFKDIIHQEQVFIKKTRKGTRPIWNNLIVEANLPEKFIGLDELSRNLWWSWNHDAIELFETIDPKLWEAKERNPVLLLKEVSIERYAELEEDDEFIFRYNKVYNKFKKYIAEKPDSEYPPTAYFSMEYGISDIIKIYSGGLGVLAGDYLKEASDSNYPMVSVGLLYKYGYFNQQLSVNGDQLVSYEPQNFSNLPITPVKDENGEFVTVKIAFPGRTIFAKIWKLNVGRVPLYLLDTDFEMNSGEDRKISHQLYGGDTEHRLKQEMLLGIGGIRALNALGIENDIYHCNEGHAAFIGLERMRQLVVDDNYTFDEALEIVRASTLFTTHTPVPAGHDVFPKDLIMIYMGYYPERLNTSWERFIELGQMEEERKADKFSMSVLAANISQEMNGVSMLHGEVTKSMFNNMWKGYFPEELHISYVTNAIHLPSWLAKPWKSLFEKEFGKSFFNEQSNSEHWQNIYKVSDNTIWDIRQEQRKILVDELKQRLSSNWVNRHVNPKRIVTVKNSINENMLTIGFARRFAAYKRAYLLFKDIERLKKIVNNPDMPVQFIFAGKAHPADEGGQKLIKSIVEVSNQSDFLGKIVFLQNYDIELAKKMVQGVDIWMNTPTRPLEASGTSGMKAVMNGVLNFSILDGWWVEGYTEGAGWMLPMERTYDNQDFQDELDAETIYTMLENEILPLFYNRNSDDIPEGWIRYIKNCIANVAPNFTTKRMLEDYINRFYLRLQKRSNSLKENEYQHAKIISTWKKKIARSWDSIEVVSLNFPDSSKKSFTLGDKFIGEVVLDLKELANELIGVEIIVTDSQPDKKVNIVDKLEMKLMKKEDTLAHYQVEVYPPKPGVFNYGIRIFPKNELLPHRQDFPYVRWI